MIRVDPSPGFMGLRNDETSKSLRLSIEIGRVKNPDKNPVGEKAILELEEELIEQVPTGGPVSQFGLVIAVARLNSHGLHHVNINVYVKFHHNIPLSSRDRAIFTFSEFGARQSLDR